MKICFIRLTFSLTFLPYIFHPTLSAVSVPLFPIACVNVAICVAFLSLPFSLSSVSLPLSLFLCRIPIHLLYLQSVCTHRLRSKAVALINNFISFPLRYLCGPFSLARCHRAEQLGEYMCQGGQK